MCSKVAKDQEPSHQALLGENNALKDENYVLQDENRALKDEMQSLRTRLEEAEELRRAISEGDLDALVLPGPQGKMVFTLDSADRAYRVLVETMNEGTATLAYDGTILYCNRHFAELLKMPIEAIIGTSVDRFIAPESAITLKGLLNNKIGTGEAKFLARDGTSLPVYLSISSLQAEGSTDAWCLVVTDLTEQKKNEEVVAAERLARSIIEQVAEAIAVCDRSGRIIRFSNAMLNFCGCDPTFQRFEDIINLRFSEGTDAGKSILPVSSALKGSTILRVEATLELNDCEKFLLLLNSGPLKNDEGEIIGCVVALADITERKQAEDALKESEANLARAQAIAHLANWEVDIRTNMVHGSEELYRMFNLEPDVLLDAYIEKFHPDDRARVAESINAAIYEGKPYSIDYRIIPGANVIRNVHAEGETTHDNNGIPTKFFGTVQDITERKRAEEALKLSEERFAKAFAHSAAAMSLVRLSDGVYLEVNKAWIDIFGYSYADIIGRTSSQFELWADDAREKIYRTLRDKGSIREEEFTMWRASGEQCLALVSAEIIAMVNEQAILISTLDITDRKRAEEALKIANETLEEKVKERTAELEKAYNSLKENETNLAEAQEMAHLGSWERNLRTGKIFWSEEMFRIFGLQPQEFNATYEAFLSLLHPDDRDYVDKAVKGALKGKPFSIEYRISRDYGEERIVNAKGEAIFDEKNIPVAVRGTIQDITERKKAEEKIQTLANIVESSGDAIITKSLDDIITSWNKGAEHIYGYSAEEVVGKPISILEPSILVEETVELAELIKQGDKIHNYETLRLRKDGTIINVSLTLSPVYDKPGEMTAISVIARNITKSKNTENELQQSEERYRIVTEQTGQMVYDYDLRTYKNKFAGAIEEVTGYNFEEFKKLGKDFWTENILDSDPNRVYEKVQDKKTGARFKEELRLRRKDGTYGYIENSGVYLMDNDGQPYRAIGVLRDITEKREAENALAEIDKLRIKEIHHRIKNNLQVISSLLDLQAEKFEDETVKKAFWESQDRVVSMALIHEELYKGGKADTLDFSAYIQKLAENLFQTYSLRSKNIRLCTDLEENAFFDMDTAVPLGIVFSELVSNSLKHAFQGKDNGEIRIELHREESGDCKSASFILTISDNGIGIPENLDIEDIDSLGMQLVTSLVDQLDGELELKRNNGTEFIIRFTVKER